MTDAPTPAITRNGGAASRVAMAKAEERDKMGEIIQNGINQRHLDGQTGGRAHVRTAEGKRERGSTAADMLN